MNIKSFGNFKIVINEGFFDAMGRAAGNVVGKIKDRINNDSPNQLPNQDDLANQILQHLNSVNTSYNRTGNFNPNGVSNPSRDIYTFIMKFKGDPHQDYKVDVIRHIDFRTNKQPEYTIVLNKIGSVNNKTSSNTPPYVESPSGSSSKSTDKSTDKSTEASSGNKSDRIGPGAHDFKNPNIKSTKSGSELNSPNPYSGKETGDHKRVEGKSKEENKKPKDPESSEDIDTKGREAIKDLSSKKTKDGVNKSYREYVKMFHPDKFEDEDEEVRRKVNDIMQRLNHIRDQKKNLKESIFRRYKDFINEEINLGGHGTANNPNLSRRNSPTVDHKKGEVLKCNMDISKQIFNKAEEVNRLTKKTTSGDARGGSNQP
jgi:hypothetical protein